LRVVVLTNILIAANMKRLLVVGGGDWQVPIVQKAKSMGLWVLNTNLYENSPAFKFSDVCCVADVLDKEKNLACAERFKINAVITDQSDIAVNTVSFVAENLGLPGIGSEISSLFTNKHLMRIFCKEHDYPIPEFRLCNCYAEVCDFLKTYGFPVVIKPPANQSSRGVVKLTSMEGAVQAYSLAQSYSSNGSVLVEQYIGGVELTVDGIKLNLGGHYSLATSCKTHYPHNEMVANRLWFSQSHPNIDYGELHMQHNQMIEDMRLPFGLTHAEYKYYEGRFYLIEVAARGGGTRISSDIVPLMSGIDSSSLLVRMALGELVKEIRPVFNTGCAVLDFLDFKPGTVSSVSGIEEARNIDGIVGLEVNLDAGNVILPPSDDRSRHGYFIATAASPEKLNSLVAEIRNLIQVTYA